MSKETAHRVGLNIEDFGTININLTKCYKRDLLKNLLNKMQKAFEEWEDEIIKTEKINETNNVLAEKNN